LAHDGTLAALRSFRSHLIWYSRGLVGAANFRKLIMTTEDLAQVLELIDQFFSGAKMSCMDDSRDDGIDYRQAFG